MATSSLAQIDFSQALLSRIDWQIQQQLNQDFPSSFVLPTQREASIDYSQTPPVIRAKLQECFGLLKSPTIAKGQVTLNLTFAVTCATTTCHDSRFGFFLEGSLPTGA